MSDSKKMNSKYYTTSRLLLLLSYFALLLGPSSLSANDEDIVLPPKPSHQATKGEDFYKREGDQALPKSNIREMAENAAIETEVFFDTSISGASVDVDVKDDYVVVDGVVKDKSERKQIAKEIAEETDLPVINKTEVGKAANVNTWSQKILNGFGSFFLIAILLGVVIFIVIVFFALVVRKDPLK